MTTTLRNAVAAGAPAHAYLFSGPRGTGKTSTGRILAKAVNCEAPAAGEADDECPSCLAFNRGQALDLIELDAASNRGIDEIRQLRESTGYAPNLARYKVYLIDEVHMLTEPAFNALLKTLEEPPPHVIFVLATTEPHKIPATILSRCQRFDFRRISLTVAVERLRAIVEGEGLTVADGGLDLIARQATGSLRDAINLLDQLVAYHGRDLTIDAVRSGLGLVVDDRAGEVARAAITRDLARGLELLAGVRDDGIEVRAFVREVVSTLRNVLMLKAGAGDQLGLADTEREALDALAGDASVPDIVASLRVFGGIEFRGDAYDSLPAEIAFASLAVGLEGEAAAAPPPAAAPQQAARTARPPGERQAQSRAEQSRNQQLRAPQREAEQGARRERAPRSQQPAARPQRASASVPEEGSQPTRTGSSPTGRGPQQTGTGSSPARTGPRAFVPPDDGDVSPALAKLREEWTRIRDAARKQDHRAGALLNSGCYIKSFEGDTVEIGFQSPFLIEKTKTLEGGSVMRVIRDVVAEAVGRPVEVELVHWEALRQGSGGSPPPQRSSGGHLVEEALRLGAERTEE